MLDLSGPHSSSSRAQRTQGLIAEKGSDFARWSNAASLAAGWSKRAAKAAKLIEPDSIVLDIGAGSMAFGSWLPDGCKYIPADIVSRSEGCLVVDLNAGEFPDVRADVVSMLGVLEYLHDPATVLAKASKSHPTLIVSYVTRWHGTESYRRGLGWVNDFTKSGILGLLSNSGWQIDAAHLLKMRWRTREYLFRCSSRHIA